MANNVIRENFCDPQAYLLTISQVSQSLIMPEHKGKQGMMSQYLIKHHTMKISGTAYV